MIALAIPTVYNVQGRGSAVSCISRCVLWFPKRSRAWEPCDVWRIVPGGKLSRWGSKSSGVDLTHTYTHPAVLHFHLFKSQHAPCSHTKLHTASMCTGSTLSICQHVRFIIYKLLRQQWLSGKRVRPYTHRYDQFVCTSVCFRSTNIYLKATGLWTGTQTLLVLLKRDTKAHTRMVKGIKSIGWEREEMDGRDVEQRECLRDREWNSEQRRETPVQKCFMAADGGFDGVRTNTSPDSVNTSTPP